MSNIALQVELLAAGTITTGQNVIFDTTVYSSGSVSYNYGTGEITINKIGKYAFSWWVAVQTAISTNGVVFALSASQGEFIIGDSPQKNTEISGIGIIEVLSVPITVSLVNASSIGGVVVYATVVPVKASLMVFDVDVVGPTGYTGYTGYTGPTGYTGYTGYTGIFNPDATIVNVGPAVSSQFNELRAAQKTPIIELVSVYGLSNLRDKTTTTGTGSVGNNGTEFTINTLANGADSAVLESSERGRYEPGFAGEAGIGIRLPNAPTGLQVVRWGVFDLQNGLFFGRNVANGIFVAIRRAGVDTVIPQASWNVDPLNGTGPSGATLNLAKGNIFQIVFTWYGYGVIEFRVVLPDPITLAQEVITVHRYSPIGQTSLADPNLPLRAEASNNGTATAISLFVGGRNYNVIGNYNPVFRITSERRQVTATGALTPVISFTRKAVFPTGSARTNSVSVRLEGIDIITSADIYYQIILGGTLNGTFADFPTATTNIPASETALRVNTTSTTITGGQVLLQGLGSGAFANIRVLASASLLDFELPDTEIVTLAVANLSGGSNPVSATFQVTEEW